MTQRFAVETSVLRTNQEAAAELRRQFEARNLLVLNLMSSPGAGKTTLLEATIRELRDDIRIAVLEGDLQTDLDAKRIQALGVRALQITTGTVCHLDARMVERALNELPLDDLDLLVIENVGNLICPSSFDLGESHRVVVCSTTEGPEKPLKYPVMFHKSDIVLINKIDLDPDNEVLFDLEKNLHTVAPGARTFSLSARTGEGLAAWTDWLRQEIATHRSCTAESRS